MASVTRIRLQIYTLLIFVVFMIHIGTIVKLNTSTQTSEITSEIMRKSYMVRFVDGVIEGHSRNTSIALETKPPPTDILILSYMRSGSSFLGQVLGFRKDAFYMYEPLFSLAKHHYFHGNKRICDIYTEKCKNTKHLSTAVRTLNQIYNCTFYKRPAAAAFKENINSKMSGPHWKKYTFCISTKEKNETCLRKMAHKTCERSKYRVTKVLRLSVSHSQNMLESNPNLKVVYLVRDPRAIINSHLHTAWSTIRESKPKTVEDGAKSICQRMKMDIQAAKGLVLKYPDRFTMVLYEDFIKPVHKVTELNMFLNMSFSAEVLRFIKNPEEDFSHRTLLVMNIGDKETQVNKTHLISATEDEHHLHGKDDTEITRIKKNGKDNKLMMDKNSTKDNVTETGSIPIIDNKVNKKMNNDEMNYQFFEQYYEINKHELGLDIDEDSVFNRNRLNKSESSEDFIEVKIDDIKNSTSPKNGIDKFTFEIKNSTLQRKLLEAKNDKSKRHGYNPFTFRKTLPWQLVKVIDKHCKDVYKLVGYKVFKNEKNFRDMSVPSIGKARVRRKGAKVN